ncbi:MAG: hypothetical protein KBA66_20840 [Leptospiraceae bacterium]|nr:hypothetical protein [Leptospiraceae bacterium]
MNLKNESNNNNDQENLLELFLKEDERVYDLALENDLAFEELAKLEESIHTSIHYSNANYLDSILEKDSPTLEALDIARANSYISKDKNLPLPMYLKNYMEADSVTKKEEDKLVIRFGKAGMKLLGSFFSGSLITPLELTIPAVRNSINSIPQSISMLEKTDQGSLVYQVIQENENEAYLSVKFDASFVALYNQVNLRKDNRFIYSSNISSEGLVSFSGLKEGIYNIEFTGKNISKRFDLSLFADK